MKQNQNDITLKNMVRKSVTIKARNKLREVNIHVAIRQHDNPGWDKGKSLTKSAGTMKIAMTNELHAALRSCGFNVEDIKIS